jgi:hypothetical protein
MRFLPLLVLLAGCINAQPFDLTVTNGGTEPTFLAAGDSTGILVGIREEIGSTWVNLGSSRAALCAPECGVPGQVVCAEMAAELGRVHGLMPGDSTTKSFDGEFWYVDPTGNCIRQAPLTGSLRANICHSPEAQDGNTGLPLDTPTESGLAGGNGGASLLAPVCEELDFTLDDPTVEVID